MTVYVTTGNLLNPSAEGLTSGMYPAGSLSQYLEANSVFDTTGSTGYGFGSGLYSGYTTGLAGFAGANAGSLITNSNAYYDYMGTNSDNMTSLQFKQRSNYHALSSYNEIMQKELVEMASAINEGEFGKASKIYDEIYSAISKNYGEELTTQEERLNADQSIKATISNLYSQVNGTILADDIQVNEEGYFENGFMQGLTLGGHHNNSSEETVSYMTGTGIEGYSGKMIQKTAGKIIGTTISTAAIAGTGAAIGFAVAGPLGAAVGGAIGGIAAIGKMLFSNNSVKKVTTA